MKEKKGFIVYFDWLETLEKFSKEQAGEIFLAMFNYGKNGVVPEFDDFAVETAFSFIKRTLERDIEAYEKRCIARSENGKKGGRPKKTNESTTNEKLNKAKKAHTETDIDTDTDIDKETETDTDTEINISTSSSSEMRGDVSLNCYSDDFLEFWSVYPKKMGKGAAYKVFNRLKLGEKEKADIITALNWQKKSEQWLKDNGRFIPYPATYLNQRRWEDEPQGVLCGDITDPDRYKDDEEDDFDFNIKEVSL